MARVLVFTATYNESKNIGPLLDAIAVAAPECDVLIVDDSSPDGTWEIIQEKCRSRANIFAVRRPRKLGIGSAHKYALIYAMREGYETLVTLDADFSHNPYDIPRLLAANGPNTFVTGSRYCVGGKSDYTGYRAWISQWGNRVARLLLGIRLQELTTYFRVFDVACLRRLPLRYVDSPGYSFGVELIFYLGAIGVALKEVPIHFSDRADGESKIPKLQILRSAWDVLSLTVSRLNGRLDLVPDPWLGEACVECGDRALAFRGRGPEGSTLCRCLRCNSYHMLPAEGRTPREAPALPNEIEARRR